MFCLKELCVRWMLQKKTWWLLFIFMWTFTWRNLLEERKICHGLICRNVCHGCFSFLCRFYCCLIFYNWSCLDIEYKSQFKQTIWEEERIMQQIFLRVLCRLKSVLELLSVAFVITQPMLDLAFVFVFMQTFINDHSYLRCRFRTMSLYHL